MNNTYQLGGKTIRSMLGLPSGVVGTKASIIKLLASQITRLGFAVTKSISHLPTIGHKAPIFALRGPGSYINAVGLDNPGAEEVAKQLAGISLPQDFFLMVSIFGKTPEEFLAAARILLPFADGFELNLSCSHSVQYGRVIGQDLDLVVRIIEVIVPLGKPVFLKLSARMDIESIVRRTRGMGIAGYAATNTLGPEPFKIDGHPVLTNKVGSFSGRMITEQALECMRTIRANTELTIIGGGGISTGKNVRNASQAGANFITVGSGLTGMSTAQVIEYFSALFDDMENGTDFAERFLEKTAHNVQSNMTYRKFEVAEKTALADDLFLLRFNQSLTNFGPGQFVFVWIPGKGERPFSTFTASPLSLLVGIKGECTRFMSQLKAGDCVYIRGPYGNIPKVRGRILLVGGGTGVAGLYQFAEDFGPNSVAVLGAKDRAHLYDAPFRLCCKVYFSTETDSDAKHRGLVTDHLEKIIWREQPDYCLNCGPLGMVKKALEIEGPFFPEDCILSSLEFHTDCGVGICGKDATPSGFRPCVDGTFLTKTQLGL